MSRVAEEKIPDCDCAKPVGTRTTFLFFWVLCVCWMRVWAEVRLFGSVSRSRLTKFQLSYKKRSKRQAHIANTFCSLACVHVCVASFWVRRTYVKHAAATRTDGWSSPSLRGYMCNVCSNTRRYVCCAAHKTGILFCLVDAHQPHNSSVTEWVRFWYTLWVPSPWGLRRLHFLFILSSDFAKLDGELAARDTRICATPYAHGIDGKKRRRRKTEKRRFEWFVLTISTRNFFVRCLSSDSNCRHIFFFSACVYECALCAQNFQN